MVLGYTSIFNTLNQQQMLANNVTKDTIQELSLASHIKFVKIFADYVFELKTPFM